MRDGLRIGFGVLLAAVCIGMAVRYIQRPFWHGEDFHFVLVILAVIALYFLGDYVRGVVPWNYDVKKERIPLNQINRGPFAPLKKIEVPPVVIPTFSGFPVQHTRSPHLTLIVNQKPTVSSHQVTVQNPRLTVLTKNEP